MKLYLAVFEDNTCFAEFGVSKEDVQKYVTTIFDKKIIRIERFNSGEV